MVVQHKCYENDVSFIHRSNQRHLGIWGRTTVNIRLGDPRRVPTTGILYSIEVGAFSVMDGNGCDTGCLAAHGHQYGPNSQMLLVQLVPGKTGKNGGGVPYFVTEQGYRGG